MKLTMTKTLLALSLSAVFSTSLAAPYELVDLGGLDGNFSIARDINEAGIAIGYANGPINEDGGSDFVRHAVLFDDAGNIDLGAVEAGTISEGLSLNDAMVGVGLSNEVIEKELDDGSTEVTLQQHAVIFESEVVSQLPDLENLSNVTAFGINNNDIIILSGKFDVNPDDDENPTTRAFVYDRQNNSYSAVEPFSEGADKQSFLIDINDNNYVLGFSDAEVNGEATIKSFIASTNDLGQLVEVPQLNERAMLAQGINDLNQVVGSMQIPDTRNQREAFVIDMAAGDSEPTFLGFFDSRFNDSRANDINNSGQIVGRALISSPTIGEYGAFIHENGEMKNLNELVSCNTDWKLTEATAINDSGQIVGFGTVDGEVRAFRLDPTGEPIEDCSTGEDDSSGGGSFPAVLVAILAVLGIRRSIPVTSIS
ncbi:DUF3466 family protein [Kangiella shandongensis]|uniref:DUF3466 family protein n=1 Tax=Kangiella shandongensis TaxID=2763258 RepID=UPI001CBD5DA9|nr:DUF3466 family protein [Kangiella shandongensis]